MTRPRWLTLWLVLLLAAPVLADAGSDAVKTYKKGIADITSRQRRYEAKALDDALLEANETYRAPWQNQGGPDADIVVDYDFSGYDDVYERWMSFEREKGEIALAVAGIGGSKVADRLVATLLEVLTDIAKLDREIMESKPKSRSIHDQVPGIKRYALWRHHDLLVLAMAKLADKQDVDYLLEKGWDKAARWDKGRKSVLARVAILDAIAEARLADRRAFVEEQAGTDEPGLRIAALEAVAALGLDDRTKELVRGVTERDPCWAVRQVANSVLAGAPAVAAEEGALEFCGIRFDSDRLIVLLDANYLSIRPLDVELMKTRRWREWRSVAEKDRDWVSQLDDLKEQTGALLDSLPEDAHFNLVLLNEGNRVQPLLPKGMVPASPKGKRLGGEFLRGILAGGWAPQIQGLWEACRIAGADPFGTGIADECGADTLLLYSNGVPRGGQLLYGPAIVDDVARSFRFNRIRIHTVRVGDAAEPAEEVMKGIAEVTGGTYTHRTSP